MAHELFEKTLDYFLHPQQVWLYGQDVQRAITAFSGSPGPLSEQAFDFFLDWFAFDFAFRPGQNLLRYACEENPMQFQDADRKMLREIVENNRYDFFEVVSGGKNAPAKFLAVRDGAAFEFSLNQRIRSVRIGEVIVCRIARAGGVWRIMTDQGVGMYRPSARDRRRMKEDYASLTSQTVWCDIVAPSSFKLDTEIAGDGEVLVSGFATGASHDTEDDCAICRAMRQAKKEGRKLSHNELMDAFAEANKEQQGKKR